MMLYICMSVAGSIPVIVCFLLWIFQRESYNFRLGKRLLVAGMLFYLMPFQLVKYLMPEDVVQMISFPNAITFDYNFNNSVSVKGNVLLGETVWIPKLLYFISMGWLAIVLLFALYQIISYRIDIHKLLRCSEEMEMDINGKKQKLLVNSNIHTPYTVGFVKQSVLVPKDSLAHSCFNMCYRHEEQHRKNHDSLMKLLCIVIFCMHWMNPITILLFILYRATAECICDAYATEEASMKEKKEYIQLLIDLSAKDEPFSMVWRNNLSASDKLIKRRISCMMKRTGMMKKGIAALVTAITVMASACTIFAYEPQFSADQNSAEIMCENEFGAFHRDDFLDDFGLEGNGYVFVFEDGTEVWSEIDVSNSSSYALCIHNMENGYYRLHKSNSTGGCTVSEYYAKRCSKCGYVQLGDLRSTTTYTVCPH